MIPRPGRSGSPVRAISSTRRACPHSTSGSTSSRADPDIRWEALPSDIKELTADDLAPYDALLIEEPTRLTRASLKGADRLRVVARFGVGYDNVDVAACTDCGVVVTVTPDGVRRAMATAAMTLVLSLSQHLLHRERLTREGRWSDRGRYLGIGLNERTIGLVGFGNIGHEFAALIRPFDVRILVSDPYVEAEDALRAGCTLTSLDSLLRESDFVVVLCALTEATRHLIDRERLRLMKPSAFLVNVARGPIVDQDALVEALTAKRIQGAGLDVFETEPIPAGDPLLDARERDRDRALARLDGSILARLRAERASERDRRRGGAGTGACAQSRRARPSATCAARRVPICKKGRPVMTSETQPPS